MSKLVAAGCDPDTVYLYFQEYFEKLRREPARWGKPLAALLGALDAQLDLELAAVGGKDSMSGSFNDMDVPPSLISFAIAPNDARFVISPEFKSPGNRVVLFERAKRLPRQNACGNVCGPLSKTARSFPPGALPRAASPRGFSR